VARIRAVVAPALLALALVALPNTKASLTLDTAWTAITAPSLVAAYQGPGGAMLAVTRAPVPNPDAWRTRTRDAYLEQVERGALAQLRGGRRLAHHHGEANGVPVLDLEVRRADGATIVLRYLLFRTYALALAIELPKGADATGARAIAASFAPPEKGV